MFTLLMRQLLTPNHLPYSLEEAGEHHSDAKHNTRDSWDRLPTPRTQHDIAERWKNVG